MRCPNCSKFVSLELQDPEVSDETVSNDEITASVRIVRQCADCSTEMKEATLDVSIPTEAEFKECEGEGHSLEVEAELSQLEEGGGRYKKSYFGAEGSFVVKCACGKTRSYAWSDKINASSMDEIA